MEKPREEKNLWDRRQYDKNKIRELLKAGPKHSKEIMEELNISSSVFKTRIDPMLANGEVESYEKPGNRRERLYRLKNLEKAEAEVKRYNATKILNNLKNPMSFEISVPKASFQAHISLFVEARGLDMEKERKALEAMALLTKKSMENSDINFWQPEHFEKVVLFFAVEGKEKREMS